ncbi:syntaxin-2-like [Eucyclogobius newberryi]|uniref:syntaxin-2-like n=1 Tax=Eucyclogobius newberryi TaxID=166745 RepID=UPI003B5C9D56
MNAKIEHFFKTVEDVKGFIDTITAQTEQVERRQNVIMCSQNHDKKNTQELEKLNKDIKKHSTLVQVKLKAMQKDTPTDENCQSLSVFQRIYKNQHSHLTRCFVEVMRRYYRAQTNFRERCKAHIQRQLEIVDKVTTDEALEEMLNCDSLSIFISDVKCDSQLSSEALNEIEFRHVHILSLESSIRELHELFTDIALLVENQGELVNNIEKNVMSAADYIDHSKKVTDKAIEYKKSTFKLVPPVFLRSFRKHSKTASDKSTT